MIHPLRPFASKYQAATHYIESGLDFFEKGKERWTLPRLTPPPVTGICNTHGLESCACRVNENDHIVGHTDDFLKLEAEGVVVAIIPSIQPDSGYVAIIRTRLIRSYHTWFQPSGYLSDEDYVSFHKFLNIRQYTGGLTNVMTLLRRDDTGKPKWENMHILLDDSGLGSMESGPFKALASEGGGRFIPLKVLFDKTYKIIEPGSKELLAAGAAQMLADLRNVVTQKRLEIPEELARNPLGKVMMTHIQSHINRGSDGSLKLGGRKGGEHEHDTLGKYEPDRYGLLYAAGLAASYAEIAGCRMQGMRAY